MKTYRKRETFDAIQLTQENMVEVLRWMNGVRKLVFSDKCEYAWIEYGVWSIKPGQWIVKDKDGKCSPCANSQFSLFFEEVGDE